MADQERTDDEIWDDYEDEDEDDQEDDEPDYYSRDDPLPPEASA